MDLVPAAAPQMHADPEAPVVPELELITAMERAVMAGDRAAAARYLDEQVRYRVGARPAAVGIDAVFSYIAAQSEHAQWTGHTLHGSWSDGRVVVVEVDSHFRRVADGRPIVLPCTDVYRLAGGRIVDWRVYADLTVFADDRRADPGSPAG
jgi:ketosteroid isomerase-like protein